MGITAAPLRTPMSYRRHCGRNRYAAAKRAGKGTSLEVSEDCVIRLRPGKRLTRWPAVQIVRVLWISCLARDQFRVLQSANEQIGKPQQRAICACQRSMWLRSANAAISTSA